MVHSDHMETCLLAVSSCESLQGFHILVRAQSSYKENKIELTGNLLIVSLFGDTAVPRYAYPRQAATVNYCTLRNSFLMEIDLF